MWKYIKDIIVFSFRKIKENRKKKAELEKTIEYTRLLRMFLQKDCPKYFYLCKGKHACRYRYPDDKLSMRPCNMHCREMEQMIKEYKIRHNNGK